jgi:hypothetical protein
MSRHRHNEEEHDFRSETRSKKAQKRVDRALRTRDIVELTKDTDPDEWEAHVSYWEEVKYDDDLYETDYKKYGVK